MRELLELAKKAAVSAGAEILKHYNKFEVYKKMDSSPLTTADLAANEKIFEILSVSGIEICSEERILGDELRLKSDRFWLVDPLDGTKEFIKQNGEFCVCIALIERAKPVLGVIFIPTTNELFYTNGNECFKEICTQPNQIINLSKVTKNSKIAYTSTIKSKNLPHTLLIQRGFDVVRIGSAIKFCRLCESGGVYIRLSPSSLWDIAAGEAIVRSCGGFMFDIKTKDEINYNTKSLKSPYFIALSKDMIELKDEILQAIGSI
ncbi:3'(2'),5'-bisphosphate nucleotidase CysQ family protein [Campylobacter mucosalis]|uniref:3'(2'),5'-bisphosphate nucleotidase CysQ family protein n=1 Tax=Campylobacter mucosalis TaxID=202 RepID=UPI0014701919|nr:3'(2'),5'-bisphosphate nucleotidase CysQ [Campylobacter mucosalis]